jgi:hypothetical protein
MFRNSFGPSRRRLPCSRDQTTPVNVHVPVQHDLAFGQGSRLIAAENLDAAEVLDPGGEAGLQPTMAETRQRSRVAGRPAGSQDWLPRERNAACSKPAPRQRAAPFRNLPRLEASTKRAVTAMLKEYVAVDTPGARKSRAVAPHEAGPLATRLRAVSRVPAWCVRGFLHGKVK